MIMKNMYMWVVGTFKKQKNLKEKKLKKQMKKDKKKKRKNKPVFFF